MSVGESGEVSLDGEPRCRLCGGDGGPSRRRRSPFMFYHHPGGTMKRNIVLFACTILLVVSAGAQRRVIGNSGRDGSLSEPERTERPARTEQTSSNALPSPPPPPVWPHPCVPLPSPVCEGGTLIVQPTIVLLPVEKQRAEVEVENSESQAVLFDCATRPELSGFDFSAEEVVSCDDDGADLYHIVDEEGPQFVVRNDTDIKDAGEGENAVVRFLPDDAWAPNHRVPVLVDHRYILWTWDNQRFVARVAVVGEDRVVIRWEQLAGGPRIAGNLADRNGERRRAARPTFDR